jgi:hypothetical protein
MENMRLPYLYYAKIIPFCPMFVNLINDAFAKPASSVIGADSLGKLSLQSK